MDFGGLLASLSSGKVDFVMAGMTPTAERKIMLIYRYLFCCEKYGRF